MAANVGNDYRATFTTTAQTVPVGMVMTLTPQINENGQVTLTVRPTITRINELSSTIRIPASGGCRRRQRTQNVSDQPGAANPDPRDGIGAATGQRPDRDPRRPDAGQRPVSQERGAGRGQSGSNRFSERTIQLAQRRGHQIGTGDFPALDGDSPTRRSKATNSSSSSVSCRSRPRPPPKPTPAKKLAHPDEPADEGLGKGRQRPRGNRSRPRSCCPIRRPSSAERRSRQIRAHARTDRGATGNAAGRGVARTQPASPQAGWRRANAAVAAASSESAQAATLIRAGRHEASGGIGAYAREHPLYIFGTLAALFVLGYGTYVYLQIMNPGLFTTPPRAAQSPPSAPITPAPAPPATVASGGTITAVQPPVPLTSLLPPLQEGAEKENPAPKTATPSAPAAAGTAGKRRCATPAPGGTARPRRKPARHDQGHRRRRDADRQPAARRGLCRAQRRQSRIVAAAL